VLLGSVVDEDVQPAKLRDGLLHRLLAERLLDDVARDQVAAAALPLHEAFRLFGILVLIQVGHGHVCALPGVHDRHGPSDPAVTAGDERDLTLELATPMIALVRGFRSWDYPGLDAGLPVLVLRRHRLRLLLFAHDSYSCCKILCPALERLAAPARVSSLRHIVVPGRTLEEAGSMAVRNASGRSRLI
jgi:hypothetical protein